MVPLVKGDGFLENGFMICGFFRIAQPYFGKNQVKKYRKNKVKDLRSTLVVNWYTIANHPTQTKKTIAVVTDAYCQLHSSQSKTSLPVLSNFTGNTSHPSLSRAFQGKQFPINVLAKCRRKRLISPKSSCLLTMANQISAIEELGNIKNRNTSS